MLRDAPNTMSGPNGRAPTGIKPRTALHYEQANATAMYRRSLTQTASGRKFKRPKVAKPHAPATVVPFTREGR